MIIDRLTKSILLRICFFGPLISGKNTSIKVLSNHFGKKDPSKVFDNILRRTLFFDCGTISLQRQQWNVKIRIYSTTGQDFYIIARPVTVQDIDGIIFVADSQLEAFDRDLVSWNELCNHFVGIIVDLPKVIAFNKQDLPDKFSPAVFLENINYFKFKNIEFKKTNALTGEGIIDCFEEVLRLALQKVF